MSHTWPMMPLGKVLTKSEGWITLEPDKRYKEVTVRLWGKGVCLRREANGIEIASPRRLVVRENQFILSRIDARNGAFGLIPDSLDGAIVSNDFPVFNLATQRIDPSFLNWMSKTQNFVDLCKAASEGTTNRVRLQENRFLATPIPLPPFSEQQRIVARIEALANKIEETSTFNRKAMKEAEALRRKASEAAFDRAAQQFPLKGLEECVEIRGGGTPSKANPFFWNGKIPWISPKDMKVWEIYDSSDHISEEAVVQSAAKLIEPGAVLVVVRGMILAHTFPSAVLKSHGTINQDMKALIPCTEVLPEYLCVLFWAHNRRILEMVEKSTHDTRKLQTPRLLNVKIPVPPIPEQRRIVAYLHRLQTKVNDLKKLQAETAAELDAFLPSILDKAFKGDL